MLQHRLGKLAIGKQSREEQRREAVQSPDGGRSRSGHPDPSPEAVQEVGRRELQRLAVERLRSPRYSVSQQAVTRVSPSSLTRVSPSVRR